MSNSTTNIPDFQSIMLPLLKFLSDENEHILSNVLVSLAKEFNLSEEDLRVRVPSGQQPLFKNRLAWSVSYLKNAGLVSSSRRGVYQITKTGKEVLKKNLPSINIAFLKNLPEFIKWQSSFGEGQEEIQQVTVPTSSKTPEEIIGDNIKTLNSKLSLELLDLLKSKPPSYFERFVLVLLTEMGYGGIEDYNFEVVGQSGDNGIDGIIYQDRFGIDRVYVQAKRWSDNKVQSKDIRDFIGSLSLKGTNKGIFITTSDFTDDAHKTVLMNPQNRIILINGHQLTEHAIKYNVGVQVKMEVQIKSLDNDFFDEE
jgi:restriction system protein